VTVPAIPEQSGFRLRLPATVRFADRVTVHHGPQKLAIERNGTCISLRLDPQAALALVRALDRNGPGLRTSDLAPAWKKVIATLATEGVLSATIAPDDGECRSGYISGLDAICCVQEAIRTESAALITKSHPLFDMIRGDIQKPAVHNWLIQNYHYTKHAAYHISPVLQHEMSTKERGLWARFLKDESWHWRIYRPVLGEMGTTYCQIDALEPNDATHDFIEAIRDASIISPIAYASVMIYIEQAPSQPNLDADPLYASLFHYYGFTRSSVRPLWWHALENATAGHSNLGSVVLANRGEILRTDVENAVSAVRRVIRAAIDWNRAILSNDLR